MIADTDRNRSASSYSCDSRDEMGFRRNLLLWIISAAVVALVTLAAIEFASGQFLSLTSGPRLVGFGLGLVALLLLRAGRIQMAGMLMVTAIIAVVTFVGVNLGGLIAPNYLWYATATMAAGWVYGPRALISVGLVTGALVIGMHLLEAQGLLGARLPVGPYRILAGVLCALAAGAIIAFAAEREMRNRINALRASEDRFSDIAKATGGYIWEVGRDWRYVFVSERSEKLFGFRPAEMMGRTPAEFMPPGEIDKVNAWISEHRMADGTVRFLEHRSVNKSGQIIWQQVSLKPVRDAAGNITGYRGTGVDITERKQAEEARAVLEAQLRESQKMQAIGNLAGGIAHDFNNIIAAIQGNTELARQDAADNAPALQSLDEIRKATARARDLVQQILTFSRRQPTERKRIALAPVVLESASLLRASLPARLTLQVHCEPDVPPVLADATQILQVIMNLVTNAMQAMPGGSGRIDIRLDTVVLDAALADTHPVLRALYAGHPRDMVRLGVRDTGAGMDPATLKRLFEPFFTTKPMGEGTGLGLSVVHGIVQGHEGAIVAESESGNGALFTIYLPAAGVASDVNEPDSQALVRAPGSDKGIRVLHIDDDPMPLALFKRYFERNACQVTDYTDPRAALEALRKDPSAFDLVLTDYNMPDLSGLDVARKVREIDANLPVVVLSGFIDEVLHAQAEGCGIREIISKTDPVDAVYRRVQRIAQSNTSRFVASAR